MNCDTGDAVFAGSGILPGRGEVEEPSVSVEDLKPPPRGVTLLLPSSATPPNVTLCSVVVAVGAESPAAEDGVLVWSELSAES